MVQEQQTTAVSPGEKAHDPVARRRRRRGNAAIAVAAAAAGAGAWYGYHSRDARPEDQPLVVTVARSDIENTIASAGALEPSRVVDVGAQVSGQLQKLHVEVGDHVEAGQLLAEIDARVQQNKVEATRAGIASLYAQVTARKAALALAESNAKRQERLWRENATSQLDYDSAVNNLESARSSLIQLEKQIEQSEATLRSDETQLEFTRIFAPMTGTVIEILLNEGVTLNANQQAPTILRIADLSTMTVETQISEADIGRVKAGMDVYFTTLGGGDRRWYSHLAQILPSPTIESNVVTYTGLFSVDNGDGALLSGMTTQVYFVTSSARNVLTVPLGALTDLGRPARTAPREDRTGPTGDLPSGSLPRPEGSRADPSPGAVSPGGSRTGMRSAGDAGRRLDGPNAARVPLGRGSGEPAPRHASVRVVHDDGAIEEREIVVGVTDRISAEVLSGLAAGERVIAGILQNEPAPAGPSGNGDRRMPPFPRGGLRPF